MEDQEKNSDPEPNGSGEEKEYVMEQKNTSLKTAVAFATAMVIVLFVLFVLMFSTDSNVGKLGRWAKDAEKKINKANTAGATATTALTLAQANEKAIDATNAKVAALEKNLAELRQVAVNQLAEHEEALRGEDGQGGLQGDVKALQTEVKKQGRRISALEKGFHALKKAWEAFKKWDNLNPEPEVDKNTSASGAKFGPPVQVDG